MDIPTNGECIAWALMAVSAAVGALRFLFRECAAAEQRERERRS